MIIVTIIIIIIIMIIVTIIIIIIVITIIINIIISMIIITIIIIIIITIIIIIIKAMTDDKGKKIKTAGPSTPVRLIIRPFYICFFYYLYSDSFYLHLTGWSASIL
jgi:hypothetical protein